MQPKTHERVRPAFARPRATGRRLVLALWAAIALDPGTPARAQAPAPSSAPGEPAPEAAACAEGMGRQAAERVQRRYASIRDIHARFEQTSEAATFAGQPLMESAPKTGRVVFAKPGKMRWAYDAPEPSVVVSDGRVLWIYDVEGRSATRLEVTQGFLSGAALQFLLGDGQILESFDVSARSCEGDRVTLDLVPKAEATYERLGLVTDLASGNVVATSVLDLFGNLTRIRFDAIEVNRGAGPETFALELPDDVEVIDYAAGTLGSGGRDASGSVDGSKSGETPPDEAAP